MKNPIIENRIVSDHTYAVRNLSLLSDLYPGYPTSGAMDDEEYEYICRVACNLVRYQVETCPDSEKWYFENLVKGYKSWKDIVLCHVCKYRPEFAHFLQAIKAV